MKESPLVSFIIPYYNAGETIQETIDSIFNQSYRHFDVWIVNDGSTDRDSIEKLKDFEGNEQIHILHQENAGPSVARNNAIKQSNSEYIFTIDADNLVDGDVIEKAIQYIEKHKVDAVHGNHTYFGEKSGFQKNSKFNLRQSLMYNSIDTCALIKSEIFNHNVEYDPFLSKLGLEDWEFWINVYSKGFILDYMNINFQKVRVSNSSRTYQVANKNINEIKAYVYKKHANLLAQEFESLYYENKMLRETPDYRLGHILLKPYRILKRLWNK